MISCFQEAIPEITPPGYKAVTLECINLWTVIMRHQNPSFTFKRSWLEYKEGFGAKSSDYFIGNFLLYVLTKSQSYVLRIDFHATNGRFYSCEFGAFSIADETKKFRATFGIYLGLSCGIAGLTTEASGQSFSTYDNDNHHKCASKMT